jgi:hypothetical protein
LPDRITFPPPSSTVLLILYYVLPYIPYLVRVYPPGSKGMVVSDGRARGRTSRRARWRRDGGNIDTTIPKRDCVGCVAWTRAVGHHGGRGGRMAEMGATSSLLFLGVVVLVVSDGRARGRTSRRARTPLGMLFHANILYRFIELLVHLLGSGPLSTRYA